MMGSKNLRRCIFLLILCVWVVGKINASESDTIKGPDQPLMGTATLVPNIWGTICTPAELTFWVYISGCSGPYTINALINNDPVTFQSLNSPFEMTMVVTGYLHLVITSVTAPGCNITVEQPNFFFVDVKPGPIANISGDKQICRGGSGTTIPVNFSTSTGMPFTFTYRANGILQPPVTTSSNPHQLQVNPTVNTVYSLVEVSNPHCMGTVTGNTAMVTVVDPPQASLSGDLTVCNQADSVLLVDFTGTGPFQLTYAIDGIPQPPVSTSSDPFKIPIQTDTSQVYTLIQMQNNLCQGTINGMGKVTVLSAPRDSNVQIVCNPIDNTYTVAFEILNAIPPVTFLNGTGTLSGAHFASTPIHQTQPFSFVFHDSVQCEVITVTGPSSCFCVSAADSMLLTADTLSACIGTTVVATHSSAHTLDGDDGLRFVLHTLPGDSLGQIFAWNAIPEFGFLPGMNAETVYYISAVVGDSMPADSIDLADICLSVSPGVPVVFHAIPQLITGADVTICNGETAVLPVQLTGIPPFSIQYQVNGIPQSPLNQIQSNLYDVSLLFSDTSTVTFAQVADQHCQAVLADTVLVTVNYTPDIANLTTYCDVFTTSYTVEFEVTGGLTPWSVSGSGGTLTGQSFISDPIPSGQPYSFMVSDVNQCGVAAVSELITCPCATYAGALPGAPLDICLGESAQANHDGEQWLDNSDTLLFYLQTDAVFGVGLTLSISDLPVFAFNSASMTTGTVYYLFAVAGNKLAGTIDLSDPCLSISNHIAVVWHDAPTATLSGNYDVCTGDTELLQINLSGTAPFALTYLANGVLTSAVSPGPVYSFVSDATQSAVYELLTVNDAFCAGTAHGTATVTMHTTPQITSPLITCDADNLHYSVSFQVVNADLSSVVVTGGLPGLFDSASGLFQSVQGDLPLAYSFQVSDGWHCSADTLLLTPDCSCSTSSGNMDAQTLELCLGEMALATHNGQEVLDGNDEMAFILHTSAVFGSGVTLASSNVPVFDFDAASMQPGITYYIFAVAGNSLPGAGINTNDPCLSVSNATPVVWHALPTAHMAGYFDVCPGEQQPLDIQFTGTGPFQFLYSVQGVPASLVSNSTTYQLPTNLLQSSVFQPLSIQDAHCVGTVSGGAEVVVHLAPQIQGVTINCLTDNVNYSVAFEIAAEDGATVQVTSSGTTGVFNPVTGEYTLAFVPLSEQITFLVSDAFQCGQDTLLVVADCPCQTFAGQITPSVLDVCKGMNISFSGVTGQITDAFDALAYVLCTDPTSLPQSILLQSTTPLFNDAPALTPGSTYFIVAVAGNPLPTGGVDFNDPCLSVSTPIEVHLRSLPGAWMSGDTSLCVGSEHSIPVALTGTAPFTLEYTLNGAAHLIQTSDNPYLIQVTQPALPQLFLLQSVQDQYCTGTATGSVQLNSILPPAIFLSGTDSICIGASTLLQILMQNTGLVNFDLKANPGGIQHYLGMTPGATISVDPSQTTVYTLNNVVSQDNGCPPVTDGFAKIDVQPLQLQVEASNFNGVGISCYGAADGEAEATVTGGFSPVTLQWSTNDAMALITDLPPGAYRVTATDAEGCTLTEEIAISEPEPLETDWGTLDLTCLPGSTGVLQVNQVQQGVGPYQIQLNNQAPAPVQNVPFEISGLEAGVFTWALTDANGCLLSFTDTIYPPEPLIVDLGPDVEAIAGDSVWLSATVSGHAPVSIQWSPTDGLFSPDQLSTWAIPEKSTVYQLTIQDQAGCTATDDIAVRIKKTRRLYFPNVISPDAGGANGSFTLYAGPEVVHVKTLSIFDRWGEELFTTRDMAPNDPDLGWKGVFRGKPVLPGVYVYWMEIVFRDGAVEWYKGDVTVVR
ncbi:MAG: gliding motility-associated C-terminal domain-containing protein [Saprospiraceae bacterium]|nr:gliding motility-associated C-terminal domain-containing protein [Saprospiraceae bacterium]